MAEDDVGMLVEVLVVDLVDVGDPFHGVTGDAVHRHEVDAAAILLRELEDLLVRLAPEVVADAAGELQAEHGLARLHRVRAEVLLLGDTVERVLLLEEVEPVVVADPLHVELEVHEDERRVGELGGGVAHGEGYLVSQQLHELGKADGAHQGFAGQRPRDAPLLDGHRADALAVHRNGLDVGAEEDLAAPGRISSAIRS
jgi:hypothetical protein